MVILSAYWQSILLRGEGSPANALQPQEILLSLEAGGAHSGVCHRPQPSASRPAAGSGLCTAAYQRDSECHGSATACFTALEMRTWNADLHAQMHRSGRKGSKDKKVRDMWAGRRCTSPSFQVSVPHTRTSWAACLHFVRHNCSLTSRVLSFSLPTPCTLLNQLLPFLLMSPRGWGWQAEDSFLLYHHLPPWTQADNWPCKRWGVGWGVGWEESGLDCSFASQI